MTVVIDVCGAMEILMHKAKAYSFSEALKNAALVLAPDLYVPELTNTLWSGEWLGVCSALTKAH
ncbi:MAG: hypothetical protein LBR16_08910 [Treponema sp.]|jgi:hypothetical protein|nr:hypothetical protein [Treponema sp.]